MDNFSNIDKQKLQAMLNQAASKSGIDATKLQGAINSGNLESVLKNLDGSRANDMKKILNNKQALESILNSPAAQKLIRDLSK